MELVDYDENLQKMLDLKIDASFLIKIAGESDLDIVEALTIQVNTNYQSLYDVSHYLINLNTFILDTSILTSIRDFGVGFTKLTHLSMNECHLCDLEGISCLPMLKEISLADNLISDITPLAQLEYIEILNLAGNKLTDFSFADSLSLCLCLTSIRLKGNLIEKILNYRTVVASVLPNLTTLDGIPVMNSSGSSSKYNNTNTHSSNTNYNVSYGLIQEAHSSLTLMTEAIEDEQRLENELLSPSLMLTTPALNSIHHDTSQHNSKNGFSSTAASNGSRGSSAGSGGGGSGRKETSNSISNRFHHHHHHSSADSDAGSELTYGDSQVLAGSAVMAMRQRRQQKQQQLSQSNLPPSVSTGFSPPHIKEEIMDGSQYDGAVTITASAFSAWHTTSIDTNALSMKTTVSTTVQSPSKRPPLISSSSSGSSSSSNESSRSRRSSINTTSGSGSSMISRVINVAPSSSSTLSTGGVQRRNSANEDRNHVDKNNNNNNHNNKNNHKSSSNNNSNNQQTPSQRSPHMYSFPSDLIVPLPQSHSCSVDTTPRPSSRETTPSTTSSSRSSIVSVNNTLHEGLEDSHWHQQVRVRPSTTDGSGNSRRTHYHELMYSGTSVADIYRSGSNNTINDVDNSRPNSNSGTSSSRSGSRGSSQTTEAEMVDTLTQTRSIIEGHKFSLLHMDISIQKPRVHSSSSQQMRPASLGGINNSNNNNNNSTSRLARHRQQLANSTPVVVNPSITINDDRSSSSRRKSVSGNNDTTVTTNNVNTTEYKVYPILNSETDDDDDDDDDSSGVSDNAAHGRYGISHTDGSKQINQTRRTFDDSVSIIHNNDNSNNNTNSSSGSDKFETNNTNSNDDRVNNDMHLRKNNFLQSSSTSSTLFSVSKMAGVSQTMGFDLAGSLRAIEKWAVSSSDDEGDKGEDDGDDDSLFSGAGSTQQLTQTIAQKQQLQLCDTRAFQQPHHENVRKVYSNEEKSAASSVTSFHALKLPHNNNDDNDDNDDNKSDGDDDDDYFNSNRHGAQNHQPNHHNITVTAAAAKKNIKSPVDKSKTFFPSGTSISSSARAAGAIFPTQQCSQTTLSPSSSVSKVKTKSNALVDSMNIKSGSQQINTNTANTSSSSSSMPSSPTARSLSPDKTKMLIQQKQETPSTGTHHHHHDQQQHQLFELEDYSYSVDDEEYSTQWEDEFLNSLQQDLQRDHCGSGSENNREDADAEVMRLRSNPIDISHSISAVAAVNDDSHVISGSIIASSNTIIAASSSPINKSRSTRNGGFGVLSGGGNKATSSISVVSNTTVDMSASPVVGTGFVVAKNHKTQLHKLSSSSNNDDEDDVSPSVSKITSAYVNHNNSTPLSPAALRYMTKAAASNGTATIATAGPSTASKIPLQFPMQPRVVDKTASNVK